MENGMRDEMEGLAREPSRKEQSLEVAVFLFLILPSMVLSFFAVKRGSMSFVLVAFATILRDLGLVSLIFFFIWRNAEALKRIGWTWDNGWREAGIGVGLYIPFTFSADLVASGLEKVGFSTPKTPLPSFLTAVGWGEFLLAAILVVVIAVVEETIFRGYLILRFRALTRSPAAAALLSAVVFSLGHGYEGSAGVVTVGFMGLIFALIYLWRQSLVASMVMHFLQDFGGVVLLPLLGAK